MADRKDFMMNFTKSLKHCNPLLMIFIPLQYLSAQQNYVQLDKALSTPVSLKIVAQDSVHTRLEIKLAGYYTNTVEYQDKRGVVVTVPELAPLEHCGAPDVPQLNRLIQIPQNAAVDFSIVSTRQRTISDIIVAPSKGFITYTQNETAILRREGEIYSVDASFPENLFGITSVGIMRDVRILSFSFNPFQYNPQKKVLTVTTAITVDFFYTNDAAVQSAGAQNMVTDQNAHPSSSFENMYQSLLVNYDPQILSAKSKAYSEMAALAGEKMLICVADKYYTGNQSIVDNYVIHKQNTQGIACIVSVMAPGTTKEQVLSLIQSKYASDAISYVLLIGDIEDIPSNMDIGWQQLRVVPDPRWYNIAWVPCSDQWYGLLAGTDYLPEVLISRISVDNVTDLQKQLNKIVSYNNSTEGAEWQKHAFLSYEDVNPVISDIGNVAANGMTFHTQFNAVTKISNHAPNYATTLQNVFNQNNGIGILAYVGHGDYNGLYNKDINNNNALIFGPGDITALTNTHFPLMYSVACLIGNFKQSDCLSELLMNAGTVDNPRGTAAIFSSTELMGIGDPEPALVAAFTDKYYNKSFKSFGDFCITTKLIALSKLPDVVYWDPGNNEDYYRAFPQVLLFHEWNILGDASTPMKLGSPLAQDHNLQNVNINGSVGPVIFTANRNIQVANVSVPSIVRTATLDKIKNAVPKDLDVRAGNQITVTPGFIAGAGTEVRIAIDPALKN